MASNPSHYSSGDYQIACTMPDQLLRHNISDEDLDVLCDPKRDELWETKWAVLGVFLGVVPSAIEAVASYSNSTDGRIGVLGLIQIVVAVAAAAVWLVLRFVVRRKADKSTARRDEIRARANRLSEGEAGTTVGIKL